MGSIILLMAASIRFNKMDQVGFRQTIKRAFSAYKFALDYREEWAVKLSKKERHEVLSQSAIKSAEIRSAKAHDKRERAKFLRTEGMTFSLIALELNVSSKTIQRWCRSV